VTKELVPFNQYKVFEPKHANDLSEEDRKKALLSSLIFLKEKKNGAIKASSCANGSVQREHVAKDEAAAPTVGLNSVFITSTIDAKERRKVVTINIPGAFLHTDYEDYVIMKMVGTLAELMVNTNPKLYRQYVILEKGKSVLYLRLKKALVSELQEMGFEINPFDPCVANKMVNGMQMTIRWHVDDLMISHLSQMWDCLGKVIKIVPKRLPERARRWLVIIFLRCARMEGSCLKSWQMLSITRYTSSFSQQTEHDGTSKRLYPSSLLE